MASHKEKGNGAFKVGDYATAVGHYTSAMFDEPNNATYPLNRAAAYLKLDKYQDAERDCEKVLQLDPQNIKGLFRRAQAKAGVGKLAEARADLLKVIKIEPNNTLARQELDGVMARIAKVEGKKKAVPPKGPMWKPLSEPTVKPPPTKSVTAVPPPVSVAATAMVVPPKTEHGSPLAAKIPTSTTPSASDSPARAAPVRKRIPIKIVDGGVPAAGKDVSRSITSSATSSRRIEEIQSSPADPPEATPTSITNPSPAPPPAPPAELSAFLTEVSSQPISASATRAPAGAAPKPRGANDRGRAVRVGGGIWKTGGDNRAVLAGRVVERAAPTQGPAQARGGDGVRKVSGVRNGNGTSTAGDPVKPPPSKPGTLFELARGWKACDDGGERWALLTTIPAAELADIFKNSLDPPFLTSMLETFKDVLVNDQTLRQTVGEYFNALQQVPRFDTLTLFLSSTEAQTLKSVQKLLEV